MKKHPDDDVNDRGYKEHKSVPYYDQVKVISKQEGYMLKTNQRCRETCEIWGKRSPNSMYVYEKACNFSIYFLTY